MPSRRSFRLGKEGVGFGRRPFLKEIAYSGPEDCHKVS